MSVDYYSCDRCGDTYCDCGHYVTCEVDAGGCGRHWCSDKCANEDGYVECSCKLGKDLDDRQAYCEDGCDKYETEYDTCGSVDCEHLILASCNYCRNEDFEYEDVVDYILEEYVNGRTIDEIKEEMKLKNNCLEFSKAKKEVNLYNYMVVLDYENDEGLSQWEDKILVSEQKIDNFEDMCKEAYNEVGRDVLDNIVSYLKNTYGFKGIEIYKDFYVEYNWSNSCKL